MSTNTLMFPGSGDVYVKYHDIIGTPKLSVLVELIRGNICPGLYNTSFFANLTIQTLLTWYINRKHENYLNYPDININGFSPEENDRILQQLLAKVSYETFPPINLLNAFIMHPIVEHLHIYTYQDEPQVGGIASTYSNNVRTVDYRFGSFEDITQGATTDATLITTSTDEARKFLTSKYKRRFVALIYPNGYDDIRKVSDIYSKYADSIQIIDISNRIKVWEESL